MKVFLWVLALTTIWQQEAFSFQSTNDEIAQRATEIVRMHFPEDEEMSQFLMGHRWDGYWQTQVEHRVYFIDQTRDIIKSHLNNGSPYEVYNFEHMWRYTKPGTTAIDIGAHVGTHTVDFSLFVGNGQVIAFEPQRKLAAELAVNLYASDCHNVVIHRMALGNRSGVTEMSPHNPENEGGVGFGRGGDRVRIETLDSFDFKNVSFIKIDVEGSEKEVLEGAIKTIRKNRPVILLEIMGGASREQARDREREIFKWFKKLGYKGKYLAMFDYIFAPKEGIQVVRGDRYGNFFVPEYY